MGAHPNPKREAYCQQLLVDHNGTQAAIRAGYSPRTAARMAHELNQDPLVIERMAELRAEQSERTGITADRVLMEIAAIGFARPEPRFFRVDEDSGFPVIDARHATEDDIAMLAEVQNTILSTTKEDDGTVREVRSVKVKFKDKLAALEKLARHTGLYAESEKRQAGGDLAAVLSALQNRGSTAPLSNDPKPAPFEEDADADA